MKNFKRILRDLEWVLVGYVLFIILILLLAKV